MLTTIQQWAKHSLANSIALQASAIAIGSGLLVAVISISVLFWTQDIALHKQLQEKSVRLTDRIERTINVVESSVSDLAKSSMFTTAMLDTVGRNAFVEPFLKNFTLPIQAANGIALCDINGVRLAGTSRGMSNCRADSPLFSQVLRSGKTVRELVLLNNGHLAWIVYQGVIFVYTGTVEGVVVTQIDLHDLFDSAPRDLDLGRVTLNQVSRKEALLSVGSSKESIAGMESAKTILFKNAPEAAPFPIELVVWKHLSVFEGLLPPLLLSYGLGIVLLVAGVMYGTRRISLRLIEPLARLTATTQKIAETGNMNIEIPVLEHGELGQLSAAFQIMVNTIRNSEEGLENQVIMRTRQLQTAEASLRSVFDAATGVAIIATDPQGLITLFNPGAERILGYQAEDTVGKMMLFQYNLPDEICANAARLSDEPTLIGMELLLAGAGSNEFSENEWTWVCKDGEYITVRLSITRIYDESRVISGYLGVAEDITKQKLAEVDLRIAATAFESQEGMLVTDANSAILRVNRAFTSITGYSAEEVIGQNPRLLNSGRQDASFYNAMWESIRLTSAWAGEIWNRRKSGEIYPEYLTITAVKNTDGIVSNYVATLKDITLRKAAADEINNLAFYDPLTLLPNRRLLLDRLKQALTSSARSAKTGALLFIDLDNFKTLNDTLGHDFGDMLLQQVARRLESCVREGDTVARLGGDEFVVMLEDLSPHAHEAAAQTKAVGEKILESLNHPYPLADHKYHSTPSIGATLFHGTRQATDELLKQADIAMYQSKKSGRNTMHFFDPKMQESIAIRADIESELRKALSDQQFQLYYQIQMDSLNRPLGAEALIRWVHPERGLVSPAQFIPLAEETGLIQSIGQWVLETACAQIRTWQQSTLTCELVLAVNVSAKQFRRADFAAQVKATMQRHAINPLRLKLELTESLLLENIEEIIVTMNALKEMGVQFSLDDFGTGYSSLQYLKRLPIDQLKIDQTFIRDIASDASDKAIVNTIVAMAHSLNMDVIAEGVETEEQRQLLLDKNCTHFQGYLFSKPVPIDQFEALLKQS